MNVPGSATNRTTAAARSAWDIGTVVALCVLYVVSRVWPGATMACLLAGFVVMLVAVVAEVRRGFRPVRELGLRTDNLAAAGRLTAIVFGPVLGLAIIYAAVQGVHRPDHFALALVLYPLWGFVQQVLFQAVLLEAFRRLDLSGVGILATSGLFVAVHYPSNFLMAFTALGAPVVSWLYLRHSNVVPLALCHGVFGAFIYYVFRAKDPLAGLLG